MPAGMFHGDVGHQRDVLDRLRLVGRPLHEELAVRVVHVLDGGFEQVRGDDAWPSP